MRFDHVDIGTCDFEVADGVFSPDKNYLLVEPMLEYLDRLPSGENIKKENSACSDKNGSIDIFYVPEEVISKYNLPVGIKGCSKIGEMHSTVLSIFKRSGISIDLIKKKNINVISFSDLVDKYCIDSIGQLKIDTEGHDHIIAREACKFILSGKLSCNSLILEYHEAFNNIKEIDFICEMLRDYFSRKEIISDNLILNK